MTVTEVVGKGRTRPLTTSELADRRGSRAHTHVDVGTGDARFAFSLAQEHPEWFVIGIDALDEPMEEIAHKASRKPAKGGVDNLVLVRASIEEVPAALHGIADVVTVVLPWGGLLEGIVLGDAPVLAGIAALCHRSSRIEVTLNGEMWESAPARFEHLPLPTPEYVAAVVAPAFASAGVDISPAWWLSRDEIAHLGSTWARRLTHGRPHPKFVRFNGDRR